MKRLALLSVAIALAGCQTVRYEPSEGVLSKDYLACRDADMVKVLHYNAGANPYTFEQLARRGVLSGNCRVFAKGTQAIISKSSLDGLVTGIQDPSTNLFYYVFNPV